MNWMKHSLNNIMQKNKKNIVFDADYARNIFDFNYIARQRNARSNELFSGNSIYSMGYVLRKYSKYKGKIYCASEHGLPAGSTKDSREYKDNNRKIIFVMSEDRRKFIQCQTNKLLVPIGPSIMPYCTNIYSDFVMDAIKRNLGKTLLVFPQHSCADSECLQTADGFLSYIDELVSVFHYDTVLVCLYYEDIYRGEFIKYHRFNGSVVVTAGHKHNYDFADCLKTIINLSDHVVTQGYGSSAIYSMYLKKPVLYFPGSRGRKIENKGIFEDKNPWMQPYEDKLEELAKVSSDHISESSLDRMQEEQWAWADKIYGFSEALSPEQIYELLEFAKTIERIGILNDSKIHQKLHSDRFKNIRELVEECICYRTENFKSK
ncbi:MAG: hypothetical protein HDR06_05260 [Lachnospiraceae bacterium]|nr:hypothetical protein [Lachnospiraceae bacterium]